jgi:hypothetical protein
VRVYFEDIVLAPIDELKPRGVNTRFLAQLACRGLRQRFSRMLAAGYRLPETRAIGALEHEHSAVRRMDHDEDGNGQLVSSWRYVQAGSPTAPSTSTTNGLPRPIQ